MLVIDANTGRVLHESSADEPRYPASLTKMMTLYLVFELIEQGRLSYQTKIKVSANAAAAAPSKLDLDEGEEIALIDAIKALITKSANDMAVAVAEHIAGSEATFARLMTQKARQLGMPRDHVPECVGPARRRAGDDGARHGDPGAAPAGRLPQALSAVCARAPSPTTATPSATTTRCSSSYEGTDGLKTGYTRASGFNLVASVRRGRKHVVGAVFGGATRRNAQRSHAHATSTWDW